MSQQPVSSATPPTQDERTMATLAQVLQLVGSWIAPLIILIVKRNSPFVSFHALQALLFQILYMFVLFAGFAGFFLFAIPTIFATQPHAGSGPPMGMFFMMPIMWLMMFGFWVLNVIVAVVYGIKAGRGEWAEYPILGAIARRMLKLDS